MFQNREEAGRRLAARLSGMDLKKPLAVLAMPRGGVPIGLEIATALGAPLGLLLVRKIGAPLQPELAAGAVVDGAEPAIILNEDIVRATGMSETDIESAAAEKLAEIEDRRAIYYKNRTPVDVAGKTVIAVDDGIATGATTRAALKGLRLRGPKRVILAVPVAPRDTLNSLKEEVDEIVCLETPDPFLAIGHHYGDFGQLSDSDVVRLLDSAPVSRDGSHDE